MSTIENTSRRRARDYERDRRASDNRGRRKINFSLLNIGKGIDIPFVLLILVLLTIGITMMFSASYPVAYYEIGDSYYYLKRQLLFALIGLAIMFGISFLDYHYYHRFAAIILGLSYFALLLVLVLPSQEGGVHRWIGFGAFGIQASEISKFAIILFLAHWGSRYYDRMDTFKFGITVVMLYVSGIKVKWLAIGAAILAVLILLLWVTGMLTYAMERMDGWGQALNEDLDREMWNSTWQTRNSLYAIGSGGLFGLGLGQSRQKYLYLPEPQNDFIFAIVCEELGLVGAVIILLIFALLVWRGVIIALRARDRFGKLLGIGLISHIGLQVILNILVITDWLPNTGISLPFFSYGGSSLLTLMFEMGVILSISRSSNIEKS